MSYVDPPENPGPQDGVKRQQTCRLTKMLAFGRSKRGKPCHQVTTIPTKIQNSVSGGGYPNYEMDRIDSSYLEVGSLHNGSKPPEVIKETQLPPKITNHGRMYKDIMTNIGLDSSTTSTESRRVESNEQNQVESLVNTPIRNSASSLIALGQQVLTPRQGRLWNGDTSSR